MVLQMMKTNQSQGQEERLGGKWTTSLLHVRGQATHPLTASLCPSLSGGDGGLPIPHHFTMNTCRKYTPQDVD